MAGAAPAGTVGAMAVAIGLGERLVARVTGADVIWSLSRGVEAAWSSVAGARVVTMREAWSVASGWRLPGSAVPGVLVAGSYRGTGGAWSFWCVHRARTLLLVDLADGRYRHWVLQVDDPELAAAEINSRLGR